MAKIPVITIIGYSNSGKTRCMTELIARLTQRGYRVAVAKHCHDAFQLDSNSHWPSFANVLCMMPICFWPRDTVGNHYPKFW